MWQPAVRKRARAPAHAGACALCAAAAQVGGGKSGLYACAMSGILHTMFLPTWLNTDLDCCHRAATTSTTPRCSSAPTCAPQWQRAGQVRMQHSAAAVSGFCAARHAARPMQSSSTYVGALVAPHALLQFPAALAPPPADYLPVFLHEIPRLLRYSDAGVDVALIQVALSPAAIKAACALQR